MGTGPVGETPLIAEYTSREHAYAKERAEADIERGSALIGQSIGHVISHGRRDFTDDSSDRQNSSETTD